MPTTSYPQAHAVNAYNVPIASSNTHPGMFSSGTKVQVGSHRVIVEKYLSEGGFAHVYVVRIPRSDNKYDTAVLKRVAVPDKDALANMRTEVDTMKKLKGHKHIVTYIDSHASQLKAGGYEVFLLMEYCQGGGLIDFMNTRLQHRLTEPEILKIISDVAEGVACMHYLKPPLLHRDLKVENVLISTSGSSRTYKLCDFGSSAPPRPAAATAQEARIIEDDVQRHTTMQYRSPEMVDVYRKQPINEKADIWALGVLLYKLCYYTTPFEEQGQMAILNASFKFPSYPAFSDRLKKLISWTLKEKPASRPTIYQFISEVCSMRNTPVPIKDIYQNRSKSEDRRYEQLPSPETNIASPPLIGIQKVEPMQIAQSIIPDIAPMRRGRPTAQNNTLKITPAGSRATSSDPFAALDTSTAKLHGPAAADEAAGRFPSLEEFSLLHDRGNKFEFGQKPQIRVQNEDLNKRVTDALADEAFGQLRHVKSAETRSQKADSGVVRSGSLRQPRDKLSQSNAPSSLPTTASVSPKVPAMVSTGVQTSEPPSPASKTHSNHHLHIKHAPIWRVPKTTTTPALTPRADLTPRVDSLKQGLVTEKELPPRPEPATRPHLLHRHRTKSQTMTLTLPTSPGLVESSRPSLEYPRSGGPPIDDSHVRSRSAHAGAGPRPVSGYLDSDLDYLREREGTRLHPPKANPAKYSPQLSANADSSSDEEGPDNATSTVDFLRAKEEEEAHRKSLVRRRSTSGSRKRFSLTGAKNIVTGRFGDAFRRFEAHHTGDGPEPAPLSPDATEPLRGRVLTPVAGSEATGTSGRSDDAPLDEEEDLSPEFKRELERRRLSQEEKRVAAAAAEYRQRVQHGANVGHVSSAALGRVSSIQSRIQNLQDDSKRAPPPTRTAEGYGRFTREAGEKPAPPPASEKPAVASRRLPLAPASPAAPLAPMATIPGLMRSPDPVLPPVSISSTTGPSASAPPSAHRTSAVPRPNVAPKPQALRTGAGAPPYSQSRLRQRQGFTVGEEDPEAVFAKKFPSLAGLEMVDMETGDEEQGSRIVRNLEGMRIRDV